MGRRETHSGRHNYKGARYTTPAHARRVDVPRGLRKLTETYVEPRVFEQPTRVFVSCDPFEPIYNRGYSAGGLN